MLLAPPVLAPALVPGTCALSAVAPVVVYFRQSATGLPADTVLTWNFGDDSTTVTGLNVSHTHQRAGTFRPHVALHYNQARCGQSLHLPPVEVLDMFIPNAFTPNADYLNNFFEPCLSGCPARLRVFSRWGHSVFESAAYHNNWGGIGIAPGICYYLLTPPDGAAPIKGWVELLW